MSYSFLNTNNFTWTPNNTTEIAENRNGKFITYCIRSLELLTSCYSKNTLKQSDEPCLLCNTNPVSHQIQVVCSRKRLLNPKRTPGPPQSSKERRNRKFRKIHVFFHIILSWSNFYYLLSTTRKLRRHVYPALTLESFEPLPRSRSSMPASPHSGPTGPNCAPAAATIAPADNARTPAGTDNKAFGRAASRFDHISGQLECSGTLEFLKNSKAKTKIKSTRINLSVQYRFAYSQTFE